MSETHRIVLGTSDRGDVLLDLPELLDTRMLVQAQSGGGKSGALRRICEQTYGRVQQIIIDVEGEFVSLREKFDYVIAGKGGDCDASAKTAKLLAQRALDLRVSVICDISELRRPDQVHFVRVFLEALVTHASKTRQHVLVVIDEAHLFAPEKGQAESAPAVIDLCTLGRKRGLCAILATQRLSKLHKDAAAELRNKLIGATGLDIDKVRAGDDLGFDKARRDTLRDLKTREFYAYGPALNPDPVLMRVGDVITSMPKAGERSLTAPPKPTEAMREVLAQLADLPAEAEQEARTVATLQAENTRLKRELHTKSPTVQTAPCDHEPVIEELRRDLAYATDYGQRQAAALEALRSGLADTAIEVDRALQRPAPKPVEATPAKTASPRRAVDSSPRPTLAKTAGVSAANLDGLKSGARKILTEIASRYPATWTRPQVGALTGFAHTGGTFTTYLGELKRRGLVVEEAGQISATDEALDALGGKPPAPTSHAEAMEVWRAALKAGCFRMLEAVVEAGSAGTGRQQLADDVSMTASGGTFSTYLGILRRNGLVSESGGLIVATDVLFPEGVPA